MFKKFAVTASALALVAGVTLTSQATPAHAAKGWQVGVGVASGLAAGAILGSALSQPRYVAPPPAYYPAPPAYYPAPAPAPVIYRPAPWSPPGTTTAAASIVRSIRTPATSCPIPDSTASASKAVSNFAGP